MMMIQSNLDYVLYMGNYLEKRRRIVDFIRIRDKSANSTCSCGSESSLGYKRNRCWRWICNSSVLSISFKKKSCLEWVNKRIREYSTNFISKWNGCGWHQLINWLVELKCFCRKSFDRLWGLHSIPWVWRTLTRWAIAGS